MVSHSKYKPIRGGSWIDLPDWIKNKKACINIKNEDEMCFKWCILAALHPVESKSKPERISHYK